jgi:hypothetical protein
MKKLLEPLKALLRAILRIERGTSLASVEPPNLK